MSDQTTEQTIRLSEYDDDHLFTLEETASILRVSTWTVTSEINDGRLPCVKIGKVRRFVRAAVLRAYIRGEQTGAIE